MPRFAVFLFSLFFAVAARGQDAQITQLAPDDNDSVYSVFDQKPEPEYNFNQYLMQNLHYPEKAIEKNIEGRVVIKFVVKKNGKITRCSVSQSVNKYLDAEALRVVSNMPPWKPGKIKGRAVKVWFEQPVRFKLE